MSSEEEVVEEVLSRARVKLLLAAAKSPSYQVSKARGASAPAGQVTAACVLGPKMAPTLTPQAAALQKRFSACTAEDVAEALDMAGGHGGRAAGMLRRTQQERESQQQSTATDATTAGAGGTAAPRTQSSSLTFPKELGARRRTKGPPVTTEAAAAVAGGSSSSDDGQPSPWARPNRPPATPAAAPIAGAAAAGRPPKDKTDPPATPDGAEDATAANIAAGRQKSSARSDQPQQALTPLPAAGVSSAAVPTAASAVVDRGGGSGRCCTLPLFVAIGGAALYLVVRPASSA